MRATEERHNARKREMMEKCTLHFCPGSGYTDINRYQIQRGNYENKEKPLTIMYISETQHPRPS